MRKPLPSRSAVLDVLGGEDRPLHVHDIAERLGVEPQSYPGLLRLLDDLVFDGVVSARGERFKLDKKVDEKRDEGVVAKIETKQDTKKERKAFESRDRDRDRDREHKKSARPGGRSRDRREGILTVNPRGFGFVASPTATGDDVFVGPDSLGGAMHGDHVTVEIIARGTRGAEGQIVEVKKRGSQRVSGVLRRRGKSAWVELDDPRVRGPVVLTEEIDRAGGEGNSGQDGQVVVAEITRFPTEQGENPEGKILAVLGTPGELSVETRKVLFLGQIEDVHSADAIADAERYGKDVPEDMLAGREDLTHIPLPTIDPEDARDHDDAVWVERTPSGGYEAWIAIADVSSYVRPGMALDDEARARGCSIYLPDRAIPMLPRALSSNLCSLLPDVIRLCLCVHAELDARGHVKKTRLVRGYMKSAAKLTYGGVARALGFSAEPPRQPKAEEMVDGLRTAYELSRLLRSQRMKRGALDFDLPEAVVKLGEDGQPKSITKRAQDQGVKKAYQLIEELMIFANEVVARWLIEHELPGVFRVHLPPDPKKLDRLSAMCEMLGIELDVEDTQTPKALADVLKQFSQHPLSNVLNNLLLRSMKQATYDVANLGHFGLASEAYLHFTSPIRRYPDLVVHRVVHAALAAGDKSMKSAVFRTISPESLADAALQSSAMERRAMEVEREIVDIYRCFYMIDRIGEQFEGTITAFVGSGAFLTIDDPFVDVMMKVEDMGGDYVIEDDGLSATSKRNGKSIRLGDKIMIEIADCAILRRTVYARRVAGASDPRGANDRADTGGRGRGAGRGADRGAGGRGPERGADRGAKAEPTRGGRGGRELSFGGSERPTRGPGKPSREGFGGGKKNRGGPGPARGPARGKKSGGKKGRRR